jgi:hypothetical protein
MSPRSERQKQRYAEDPKYRARILACNLGYRTAHREEINAKARDKWATDPEFRAKGLAASCARDSRADKLKQLYGLSTHDYDAMLRAQNGVCAICKRQSESKLCVDHDHAANLVRGLLGFKCNSGLGCFRDDPKLIAAAIAYRKANGAGVRAALGRAPRAPNADAKLRCAVPLSHVPGAQEVGQRRRRGPVRITPVGEGSVRKSVLRRDETGPGPQSHGLTGARRATAPSSPPRPARFGSRGHHAGEHVDAASPRLRTQCRAPPDHARATARSPPSRSICAMGPRRVAVASARTAHRSNARRPLLLRP